MTQSPLIIFIITIGLSFAFGLLYRAFMRKVAQGTVRGVTKNIDKTDRITRAILGAILFVFAVYLSWNPIILFFAGFCFFEALFSWCGFYALIGRSTCPIE